VCVCVCVCVLEHVLYVCLVHECPWMINKQHGNKSDNVSTAAGRQRLTHTYAHTQAYTHTYTRTIQARTRTKHAPCMCTWTCAGPRTHIHTARLTHLETCIRSKSGAPTTSLSQCLTQTCAAPQKHTHTLRHAHTPRQARPSLRCPTF